MERQCNTNFFIGKLPWGSLKRNWYNLNRCSPYTEIFSKRRKIYSECVESMRMPGRSLLSEQTPPHLLMFLKRIKCLFQGWDTRLEPGVVEGLSVLLDCIRTFFHFSFKIGVLLLLHQSSSWATSIFAWIFFKLMSVKRCLLWRREAVRLDNSSTENCR